jgi:hypothetical protein
MNRYRRTASTRREAPRTADFESGILAEPLITFGRQHQHVDPKTGLALYGPYSLKDQIAPALRGFIVGIVGPRNMVADAEQWLAACGNMVTNDGSQPFQSPHFPGMRDGPPFACTLTYGEAWREVIRDSALNEALATQDLATRITNVVALYLNAIEILSTREPKPGVVLCCFPQPVVDSCAKTAEAPRPAPAPKTRPADRRAKRISDEQLDFFAPEVREESEADAPPDVYLNLRRGLKAGAMQYAVPTQIVWPRTLALADVNTRSPKMRAQDPATRAWNFCTALYHKAGGVPWRPADFEPGVCFVGLSFYHERSAQALIRTSMAQAYTAAGDGYVLRGASFEWDSKRQGRTPHLTRTLAAGLMRDVVALYKRQNRDTLPSRVVVHKTSRFWEEEIEGITEGLRGVARHDLVALGRRGLQFYRAGEYPVLRGTYVKLSDDDLLLYTSGYVPYLRTYPGARVPQPLEVVQHAGDSPWDRVLRELLALTKLNWNTAAFAGSHPVTIAFSRRVGEVLAELSPHDTILADYRFFM